MIKCRRIGYTLALMLPLIILLTLGGCGGKKDFIFKTEEYGTETVKLNIDLSISDVKVERTDGEKITLEYYDTEEGRYDINEENGVLSVSRLTDSELKENIRFGFGMGKYYAIKLGIPDSYDGEVNVTTESGDIEITGISVTDGNVINVKSGTGDVKFKNAECTELSVNVTSSDVEISDVNAEKFRVNSVTGDVYINKTVCGQAKISATAANVKITDFEAGDMLLDMSTGDLKLKNCELGGTLSASLTTGNFEGNGVSAGMCVVVTTTGDVYFKTVSVGSKLTVVSDTGDITANITDKFEEFTVSAKSDYGKNNLKDIKSQNGSKRLEMKTVTGEIKVKFPE